MLVQEFLQNSADWFPDKTALISEGVRLTYAQIEERCNQLAHALIAQGVQRGDRIVVHMPNSPEAVLAIFAILKAGATFVVVNHTTKQDKLLYILNNCRATGLFTAERTPQVIARIQTAVPSLRFIVLSDKNVTAALPSGNAWYAFDEWSVACPVTRPPCCCIDQDLACLIYTSGSTGDPKGVISGHNNMVFASGSIIKYLENTPDDIVLNVLPLSFDYGLYQLLMVFRFGGTLVLERSFTYPAAVLKRIAMERVTGFPGVPTIYAILQQMDLSPYELSSLRYLSNTAAALPPSHVIALRNKFPGVTLYSMYGLTECKRALYLPPEQLDQRPDSVGIPIPGTEAWIEDEEGRRVGPGVVGELVLRGSHVMRGYWENPPATAERYRPGPTPGEQILYSGDLFRMDQEGYFYFVGRKDDIIKSRGEKVSPKEIENVLYGIPGVVEAAVIGVPDPLLGQAIKAFVVMDRKAGGLSGKDILRHCRMYLEDFMLPKYVELRDSLPKTATGKIRKTELS